MKTKSLYSAHPKSQKEKNKMPYQPTNPYLPYGNMRSSKTGSRAIAAIPPKPVYPDFNGIPTMPNPPEAPAPLQGGLGRVVSNGHIVGELQTNQKQTRGKVAVPQADSRESIMDNVEGGGQLVHHIDNAQRFYPTGPEQVSPMPAQPMRPDPRAGWNPQAAAQANNAGLDPTSEAYAQMLLGHAPTPQMMPQPQAPAGMPPGMPSPDPQMPMADPSQPDWFQPRTPEFDDSMGAPDWFQPRTPEFDGNPDQPIPPEDPYQRYALPQFQPAVGPAGAPSFYDRLGNVANAGIDNKERMDQMRWKDWNRDNIERGWDEFAGNMLTPLGAAFAQDPATRSRMQASAGNQLNRYSQNRQLRNSERQQQFGEDKYYTDMQQANDPNALPNWMAMQQLANQRMNATSGMVNAQSLWDNRASLVDNRGNEHERKLAWDEWRMRNGDSAESRRAYDSLWRQNQGQQRIDNQQSQFGQSMGLREQEVGLRRQTLDITRQRLQEDIRQAVERNDITRAQLAQRQLEHVASLYALDPKTGEPKYADEAFSASGVTAPAKPESAPSRSIFDFLKGATPAQPKTEVPKPPNKKSAIPGKGIKVVYDPGSKQHQEWFQQAISKYPQDKAAAKREFIHLASAAK